ncbi:uncharacterized protein ATNIH1004_004934 [Aspergillus tanneri]|uniref:Uncharacterized protein n=1 Tax=Aspergillus tanneri TaxID=1220188 RepID=A0A5M9MPM7_9EURO|nr:uncharacterized protein ATNIH1004_004934 [Aspergillus tanneri]KAA8649042.1 hypothetical protein ATNIH1004_004934 [Aspergillus tanneri]
MTPDVDNIVKPLLLPNAVYNNVAQAPGWSQYWGVSELSEIHERTHELIETYKRKLVSVVLAFKNGKKACTQSISGEFSRDFRDKVRNLGRLADVEYDAAGLVRTLLAHELVQSILSSSDCHYFGAIFDQPICHGFADA